MAIALERSEPRMLYAIIECSFAVMYLEKGRSGVDEEWMLKG
jgi:hypothetical protein